MPQLAVGSWPFVLGPFQDRPLNLHTVLHALEDAGITGLELGAFAPHPTPDSHDTKEKRDRLRKEVADHGLAFSALLPDLRSQKILTDDGAAGYLAGFEKHLRFAVDLGITTIIVDTVEPVGRAASLGLDGREEFDRVGEAFAACARLAAADGVRVVWEFAPGQMIDSPAGIVALAERVRGSHPNFGVLFDTCNADLCARAGSLANPVELLRQLSGKVTHLHIADSDGLGRHVPPGEGKLRWDSLVPELLATGAEWWTIDLGDWPEAFDGISESKRFLSKLLKKHAAG